MIKNHKLTEKTQIRVTNISTIIGYKRISKNIEEKQNQTPKDIGQITRNLHRRFVSTNTGMIAMGSKCVK